MGRCQVNWKFWKKEDTQESVEFYIDSSEIPTSTLVRWALYDSCVPNPNKYAQALGFNPVSKEGEEMEIQESKVRLEKLEPYDEFIYTFANISGDILAETFSGVMKKIGVEITDEDLIEGREIMAELYSGVALSCIIPAFSIALHLGIIVNPGAFVTEASDE